MIKGTYIGPNIWKIFTLDRRSRSSHPDHNNCYLYSSRGCGMDNLMENMDNMDSHWRTGGRSTVSHKCHQFLVNMLWPRMSGESDLILNY